MNLITIKNSKITHGIEMDVFSKTMKKISSIKGPGYQLDTSLGMVLADKYRSLSAEGSLEIIKINEYSALILIEKNSIASIVLENGEDHHFFNNPLSDKMTISRNKPSVIVVDSPVLKWLAHGEVGASSKAMCRYIFDMPDLCAHGYHPVDPADLFRCRKFYEMTECKKSDLDKMREVSPVWNALIDNWDLLCGMMDDEVDWMRSEVRTGKAGNTCNKTYNKMKEIIDSVKPKAKMRP